MIIDLLTDYARDLALRNRFATDPSAVLSQYGVTDADYQALLRMTPAVRELLPTVVSVLLTKIAGLDDESELKWPGPVLSLNRISPDLVSTGVEARFTLKLDVKAAYAYLGESFTVVPTFTHSDGVTVVTGTAVLPITLPENPVASVSFDCSATFAVEGSYKVDVAVANLDVPYTKHAVSTLGTVIVRGA